jgi:uncharacterized protein (DUF488 family)
VQIFTVGHGTREFDEFVELLASAGVGQDAFRNYADYTDTDEFRAGLAELLALAAQVPTAYLCAETHWSRCHRRIISDKLCSLGHEVIHLITPTRHEPHTPTPFLHVEGDHLRYV